LKLITILSFLLASYTISGQTTFISSNYRLQYPGDFKQTSDHGYLIGGSMLSDTNGGGLTDIFALVKLDSLGNQQWNRLYSDLGHDCWVTSVFQSSDGNYVFCGVPDGMITYDAIMTKVGPFGNLIWSRKFSSPGNFPPNSIMGLETRDGNYIASFRQYGNQCTVVKLTPGGNFLWEKNISDSNIYIEGINAIAVTSDSGVIILGSTDIGQCMILRLNSLGQIIWNKMFSDPTQYLEGTSICQTFDDGYLLGGNVNGKGMIIKTNLFGDTLWTKMLGGSEYHFIHSLIQTNDSNYVITGKVANINPQYGKFFLLKIDQAGDTLWTRTYSAIGDNLYGLKTIEDLDSGLTSLCVQGNLYASVYKLDKNGIINCNQDTSTITLEQRTVAVSSVAYNVDTFPYVATATISQMPYSTPTLISCFSINTNVLFPFVKTSIIFPNPATHTLHIDSKPPIKEILIYGLAGNLLFNAGDKNDVDISFLDSGMYYVVIKTAAGIAMEKFIKT
jgi:hypothetical protein